MLHQGEVRKLWPKMSLAATSPELGKYGSSHKTGQENGHLLGQRTFRIDHVEQSLGKVPNASESAPRAWGLGRNGTCCQSQSV
jgi:hypothetical protein